jgi:hypothetical protein
MQMADLPACRATPRPRPASASRCSSGSTPPPQQLPGAQPRSPAQGAGHQGREHRPGHAAAVEGRAAGPCVADRRERVRGGPQRGHHRRRGGVRERAVPADRVQAAHGQGARAAHAVRAAVHQQVLHPRPAARELGDPLHGRAGPPGVRGELAQPRRVAWPPRPGTTTSSTAHPRHPHQVQAITGADRSTRWASASAAPSWPPRWRCWRRAASSRRAVDDAADHAARLLRDTGVLDIFVDEPRAAARDDHRRPGARAPACSRARSWPPPSASCARTTWSGTTWSATT